MRFFKFFKRFKFLKKTNLSNSVTLYLSGYNLERYLNNLCSKNIKLLAVEKLNAKNSKIEVELINENIVEDYLKGKNIDVIKKEYNGTAKVQKFFFSRYGILIGIFFAFCFYVVASNYVLDIKIMGNETRSSQEIVSVLKENGVNIFNPLNIKDNDEIEKIVMDNFNEVSMVSVIKKGNTILINIKEKLLNDEYEQVGSYTPLIATADGLITDIELIQGTLLVKIGDIVRVGDKLVAPYVIDSSGQQISIEPKANVYANIWLAGESVHYDVRSVTERTGQKISERVVTFLNRTVYSNDIDVSFEEYEKEVSEVYLTNLIIPVKYQIVTYYETVTRFIEQSFAEVEQEMITKAKQLAAIRLVEGEKIESENHSIDSSNGKTTVSYSITVKRKIS